MIYWQDPSLVVPDRFSRIFRIITNKLNHPHTPSQHAGSFPAPLVRVIIGILRASTQATEPLERSRAVGSQRGRNLAAIIFRRNARVSRARRAKRGKHNRNDGSAAAAAVRSPRARRECGPGGGGGGGASSADGPEWPPLRGPRGHIPRWLCPRNAAGAPLSGPLAAPLAAAHRPRRLRKQTGAIRLQRRGGRRDSSRPGTPAEPRE